MINEIKDYERAVYTFQAARGRYPGDVKNYGTFGMYSNYQNTSSAAKPYYAYKATDFPSEFLTEFQNTAGAGVLPNYEVAPFVELYNEGIIDFKPLGNERYVANKKGTPSLKYIPETYGYFLHTATDSAYTGTPCTKGVDGCYSYRGSAYSGQIKELLRFVDKNGSATKGFDPKLLKSVDEKMDDGWYSTGIFRGSCYGSINDYSPNSYDNAIKNGKKCNHFNYIM